MSLLRDAWRHAPTHHRVWALAGPMILSNVSVPLVHLVDSTVVGHLPHAYQLGAVAVGGSLYTLMVGVLGFLRMGTTGFAAQAAGRDDGGALRRGRTGWADARTRNCGAAGLGGAGSSCSGVPLAKSFISVPSSRSSASASSSAW